MSPSQPVPHCAAQTPPKIAPPRGTDKSRGPGTQISPRKPPDSDRPDRPEKRINWGSGSWALTATSSGFLGGRGGSCAAHGAGESPPRLGGGEAEWGVGAAALALARLAFQRKKRTESNRMLALLISVMCEVSWHPRLIIGEVMHATQFQKMNFNVGLKYKWCSTQSCVIYSFSFETGDVFPYLLYILK